MSGVVDRKYLVTTLRRCERCRLLFRAPTTSPAEFTRFYQSLYSEGFTTEMPSDHELRLLKESNFRNSGKDYSTYIDILTALGCRAGQSILDFGCSWGYGSWQFTRAGFDVTGFEISQSRCQYAKSQLGINAHSTIDAVVAQGKWDVFFSAHVLEHIPDVSQVIDFARRVVRPGGLFVSFTPNGSAACRSRSPESWRQIWGFVHPLFLDEEFYVATFGGERHVIDSSPFDLSAIKDWATKDDVPPPSTTVKTSGNELMIAVRLAGYH
jgi:2-polyprenyl-3-methyl-5-hydroxy-6-metoxy-1,4-benzoquinol methylase